MASPDDLDRCPELSFMHADGTTECVRTHCAVPHALHKFTCGCEEIEGCCVPGAAAA